MTPADLRKQAADAGITEAGAYCEWLEARLIERMPRPAGVIAIIDGALGDVDHVDVYANGRFVGSIAGGSAYHVLNTRRGLEVRAVQSEPGRSR